MNLIASHHLLLARMLFFALAAISPLAAAALAPDQPVPAPSILSTFWPAHWISHPQSDRNPYGVFLYRKTFELAEKPAKYVVHVSADARYRLWVNGQSVCFGPQRGDQKAWRFETIDLAPWLHAGTNTIAARVWNHGELNALYIMTVRTGFILQGDTAAEAAVESNATWKVTRDDSFAPIPIEREKLKAYIVIPPGNRIDGATHPWGWEQPGYDDSKWSPARNRENGMPGDWGTDVNVWLRPRNIPLMEETAQRLGRVRRATGVTVPEGFVDGRAPLTVPARSKAVVLLDQGFETNAFPQLTVSGGQGGRAKLSYAEALFDAQGVKGHRDEVEGRVLVGLGDEFLPDGGSHRRYAPLDFRTYRYMQLEVETGDDPMVIEDLQGVFTGYPFSERAAFSSDDPSLRDLWQVGWRTARLCAQETYVDCPYYEQLQYVGDTRIQSLISLYVAGDDRLMRNAIELYDRSRIPEGLTQSRYPCNYPQVINTFSLFWVDMVHDYWMHRTDPVFVRARLQGVQSVLNWFEQKIDPRTGLLGPLPYWSFVDWADQWPWDGVAGAGGEPEGARTGGSIVLSLQFATTLRRAEELCRGLGRADLADRYAIVAQGLREAAVRHCWDGQRRMFADAPSRKTWSQHANVLAVLSGAVQGEAARDLIQRVANDNTLIPCSTYFRFYLLRAMKQAGLGEQYLSRLGPWRAMLGRGLTTFAEQPDPTRSDCHAWSASPVYEMLATVLGIEPASPGFASVRIEPHLGSLKHAEGRMPHPKGDIIVHLERADKSLRANVDLPAGLSGVFVWHGKTVELHPGRQELELPAN